jgi:tRNA1Val (adenine37-N6)-methyltransferase
LCHENWTDGVLLGAWANRKKPFSILILEPDLGSCINVSRNVYGQIDALEIDQAAYEQAVDNFENSLD